MAQVGSFRFDDAGREDMGLLRAAARKFEVRQGGLLLGEVVQVWRGNWRPILPTGERAEFTLPSRRQAAEWLLEART